MLQQHQKNNLQKLFFLGILLSIFFIHLPLGTLLYWAYENSPPATDNQEQKKQEPVLFNLKSINLPKTIADIDIPANQQIPEKPSVLAQYNSTVKEETVSINSRPAPPPQGDSTPQPKTPSQPAVKPTPPKKTTPPAKQEKIKTPIKPKVEQPTTPSKTAMNLPASEINEPEKTKTPVNLASEFEKIQHKRKHEETIKEKSISVSKQQGQIAPGSNSLGQPSGDYLPSYKVGGRTYLNAIAYPNVFYFVEIKRKFRAAFNPLESLRKFYGKRVSIEVVWGFTLDKNGNIKQIKIIRKSDVPSYDAEALRTIRQSAPFSKPPRALLDENEELNLAWGFIAHF